MAGTMSLGWPVRESMMSDCGPRASRDRGVCWRDGVDAYDCGDGCGDGWEDDEGRTVAS